jgi:hypothetical protein
MGLHRQKRLESQPNGVDFHRNRQLWAVFAGKVTTFRVGARTGGRWLPEESKNGYAPDPI